MRLTWPMMGLAAALTAAGCGDRAELAAPDPSFNTTTVGQTLLLCKIGPAGSWADFSVTAPSGTFPLGNSFRVDAMTDLNFSLCKKVWQATEPGVEVLVTVTETNATPGTELVRVVVASADPSYSVDNPDPPTVVIRLNYTTPGFVSFKNVGVPFEEECNGLTPGYWKNWRNHYTAAQFASLLAGTIANGSIATADAIFAAKPQSSPVARLKWFVLANQLTMNLTGTSLPNPDDANLGPTCQALTGGGMLGGTLAIALDMIANPGNYTQEEINEVKDVLDGIANMD